MKRRTFLQSTIAASCLPLAAHGQGGDDNQPARQFLEWRRYTIANDNQYELVSRFWQRAALPALQRLGIGPVGVFTETDAEVGRPIYVLIPFDSPASLFSTTERLAADDDFLRAADEYLVTDKTSPAYERIDNQWMVAFSGFPRVQTPRSGERIFELRIYESHNEQKAKLKIEMFNQAELKIFRNVGLDAVFFGETLIGSNLPNLTYMLAYQDMAEHDRVWQAFRADPDWLQLRDAARYADTVSNITSRFLTPTAYSQI
jgi:hypothetical protein